MRKAIIISGFILIIGGGIALIMLKRKRKDPLSAIAKLR